MASFLVTVWGVNSRGSMEGGGWEKISLGESTLCPSQTLFYDAVFCCSFLYYIDFTLQ